MSSTIWKNVTKACSEHQKNNYLLEWVFECSSDLLTLVKSLCVYFFKSGPLLRVFSACVVSSPAGGPVAVLLSSFWLRPRQTVVVPGPSLMSGFAALQRSVPPCWCGAAEHHSGLILLQSYKSPAVSPGTNYHLGMDKHTEREAADGEEEERGGGGQCKVEKESVSSGLSVHLHLCPKRSPSAFSLKAIPLSCLRQNPLLTTSSTTSSPSPAAPSNCLY